MRVTHVITRLIVGGAQENTIASVLGLKAKPGMDVDLISGPDSGLEGSLVQTFNHSPQTLTILPELVRPIHPWKDIFAWLVLTRRFREHKPDIVHTHSGKAGVLGRLAAHRAGVPIIVHTIHGPSFGAFQGALTNLILLTAERSAGKVTTHFVAVADAMTRQYLEAGIGQPAQYSKILSGFPLAPFLAATNNLSLRAKFGLTPQDIVIGKVARFFRLKGHEDLFQVAPDLIRHCPQIKFLLVGDGPLRSQFEQKARGLKLEKHFVFTGLVPPTEVAPLIGIMDVLVHLSLREGLARALPQALAAARPVVAYDCDGAGEVCRDNETGFLIRAGDLAGLRERLHRLATDPRLRERLGKDGRLFVEGRFAVERMVDDLFALYLNLAKSHNILPP